MSYQTAKLATRLLNQRLDEAIASLDEIQALAGKLSRAEGEAIAEELDTFTARLESTVDKTRDAVNALDPMD
jgi:signal transduction histidine kinase